MSPGSGRGHTGMTSASFVDLAPAADRVTRLLDAVTDDRLEAPTPCADTTVGALLSHLLGLTEAFRAAAAKEPDLGTPPAVQPPLDPQWRTLLPRQLDALVAAWREPGAVDGMTSAGGVQMPAAAMAAVALDELVLHGWDLARATGQDYTVDQESAQACLGFVEAAAQPEGVPGLFGPPVPVPGDAPVLDRLVGLSGRDPAWTPATSVSR
jgi:uncharacterized protein (TIGR03086 family)